MNQGLVSGATVPRGVAIAGNYIYWASDVAGIVGRANIDDTDVNDSLVSGASQPYGIAVVVPEPATPLLVLGGMLSLAVARRQTDRCARRSCPPCHPLRGDQTDRFERGAKMVTPPPI